MTTVISWWLWHKLNYFFNFVELLKIYWLIVLNNSKFIIRLEKQLETFGNEGNFIIFILYLSKKSSKSKLSYGIKILKHINYLASYY
jgi:hypothetical protein